MKYPNALKALREREGLTQKQLAAELGVTCETVKNWENGKRPMKSDIITALVRKFKVTSDYLLQIVSLIEFEPCPFCGKEPNVYISSYGCFDDAHYCGNVECAHCRIRMVEHWSQECDRVQSVKRLAERWNRREYMKKRW